MKNLALLLMTMLLPLCMMAQKSVYDFNVKDADGKTVKMKQYKGKVLLIVNTASHCGFTPQYEELQKLYGQFQKDGLEILDFPCNQFGMQAPENDHDYVAFCKKNFGTEFKQFHKIDVNGKKALPLYVWLKAQKGFAGFDPDHRLTPVLEQMFDQNVPGWRESSDIKWNFTKFLIDKDGNVVERFEPTVTAEQMLPIIEKLLK